jgi:hypothetical protein
MGKTIEDHYDAMIAEKNTMSILSIYQPNIDSTQTLLSDLKSTSRVARWRLVFWVVATCAYALGVDWELCKIELEAVAARSRYGTLPWYVRIIKEFQYGDPLVLIDDEWQYATINTANRCINLAAAQEGPGVVNVKIAALVGGVKQPVSAAQEIAAKAYLMKKKPAGIRINVINDNPDDLILAVTVNYDPLVLTSTGESIANPTVFPVDLALALYLESLEFDGAYELMSQVDYIQKAVGVKTAYITAASARYGSNPFAPFTQRYYPNAGYMTVYPSTVITYVPYV